jgi:hypothetical protein
MDISNQRLIEVFDMINERLYNIEISQQKMITHLKNKCIEQKKLDKDLFSYPMNVCVIDNFDIKPEYYVYVSFQLFDNLDELDKLCHNNSIYNNDFLNKVKYLLPNIFDKEQLDVILNEIELQDENDYVLHCSDINIDSLYKYVGDYICTKYITDQENRVVMIVPSYGSHYDIVFKGLHNLDECIECFTKVYELLGLPLHNLASLLNNITMNVIQTKYWLNFEILLNIDEPENAVEIMKIKKKDIEGYCSYLKTIPKQGFVKYHWRLNDDENVQTTLTDMHNLLNIYN